MKLIKKNQNHHGLLRIIQCFIILYTIGIVLTMDKEKEIIGRSYSLSDFCNPIPLNQKLFNFLRENKTDIQYKIKNQDDQFPTDQDLVPLVYDPMVVDEKFFNSFWQKHSELSDGFKKLNNVYGDLNNQWENLKIENKQLLEKYQQTEKTKEQFFKHNSQLLKEYYTLNQEKDHLKEKLKRRNNKIVLYLSMLCIGGFFQILLWLFEPIHTAITNYNSNYCYNFE